MPGPGRRMLVIKKDLIEQNGRQLMEIDPMEFHTLLDIAASTYDIENTETKAGTSARKIKWSIQESERFRLGRTAIQSRIRGVPDIAAPALTFGSYGKHSLRFCAILLAEWGVRIASFGFQFLLQLSL